MLPALQPPESLALRSLTDSRARLERRDWPVGALSLAPLPASLVVALLIALPPLRRSPRGLAHDHPCHGDGARRRRRHRCRPSRSLPRLSGISRTRPLSAPDSDQQSLWSVRAGFANTAPGLGVAGAATLRAGHRPYAPAPIRVEVLATDNVFQTSDARGDIVTTIAPSLEAAIATTRLTGTLRYTPALRLYATYSSQDGIDQVGDGRLLAALVPGLFYVDVRGAASVLPTFAGFIPGSGQLVAGSDTMQTYTAQVTPFLVQRFGSAATVQAGYSFQYSSQNFTDFNQSSPDFGQSSRAWPKITRRIAACGGAQR